MAATILLTALSAHDSAEAAVARVVVTGGLQEFTPQLATIKVGDRVVWINQNHEVHSLVSSGPSSRRTADGPQHLLFNTSIPPGSSYSHTFVETGTYEYFCAIHAQVWGVVVVEE